MRKKNEKGLELRSQFSTLQSPKTAVFTCFKPIYPGIRALFEELV
jgi:hypothetical protein